MLTQTGTHTLHTPRTAVIAGVKHPRGTTHSHRKHPYQKRTHHQRTVDQEVSAPAEESGGPGSSGSSEPGHEEHVHGLQKLALDLKTWLYAWTKSGYEPL